MRDIRIAIAIFNASVGNTRGNLDKASGCVKNAAAAGAEVICFPEMNITGYSNHPDIAHAAEPIPGPSVNELVALSKKETILILAGLAE